MMNTNNEIPAYGVNEKATQRSQLTLCYGSVWTRQDGSFIFIHFVDTLCGSGTRPISLMAVNRVITDTLVPACTDVLRIMLKQVDVHFFAAGCVLTQSANLLS